MYNSKITITTEWEIRITDEQEQEIYKAALAIFREYFYATSVSEIVASEDEEELIDFATSALAHCGLYDPLEENNELIFVKHQGQPEFEKAFNLAEVPYDTWIDLMRYCVKLLKKMLKNALICGAVN